MNQKVLEVLIPTYRRPLAALGAIDSVLVGGDTRVGVFCHSNGVECELEAAVAQRPAVRYAHFPENRGAAANFRKLLEASDADYVLFLSDEDNIDAAHMPDFLDFLCRNQHSFVLCSIVESITKNYFSVAALRGETLSLADLLVLFPIDPTYLSGYCFRRDLLSSEVIDAAFENNEANVYPHLILRNAIASRASIGIFAPGLIVKGAEANVGGDSHAHVESTSNGSDDRIACRRPLNPRIYGEGARARQFYYLMPRLCGDLASLSYFRRAYAKIYVLSAWLKLTGDAHLHVAATTAVLATPLESAVDDHRRKNATYHSLIDVYDYILSIRPRALRTIIVKLLWSTSKAVKLALFVQRFGMSRTIAFVRGKHG